MVAFLVVIDETVGPDERSAAEVYLPSGKPVSVPDAAPQLLALSQALTQ